MFREKMKHKVMGWNFGNVLKVTVKSEMAS